MVDAAHDYAQHIPVRVITNMLGFPPQDGPQFREFVEDLLEGINLPPDDRVERVSRLFDYLLAQVHDHLDQPRNDLTTYLIDAELYGRKLDPSVITGAMALLLIAGIDTSWSAIGASLWHLAKTPGDRERLVAEPGLLPTAMEEFLRAYAPVTMARLVKKDMHWHGIDMKADDWILLCSLRPTVTQRSSTGRVRSSSTARSTGTPLSAWASTAAWVRTWRGWSFGSPSRCRSSGSRRSPSMTPAR